MRPAVRSTRTRCVLYARRMGSLYLQGEWNGRCMRVLPRRDRQDLLRQVPHPRRNSIRFRQHRPHRLRLLPRPARRRRPLRVREREEMRLLPVLRQQAPGLQAPESRFRHPVPRTRGVPHPGSGTPSTRMEEGASKGELRNAREAPRHRQDLHRPEVSLRAKAALCRDPDKVPHPS